ncbi:hypothetical protein N7537_002649 [Penicillium hordei]|uniref:Major facilitator superfamily (MFS) profile domain-containing protein n=1 Tax=Penicillium hordei TaxID=40994 RepID=A0AAD6H8V3_9EURO|nr:uncharacterized protein N7537_002649 [Penicillium hordei]KAJ5617535.1 hypothetical protein N7537_002649 [Penicillium hordei]
MLNDEQAQWKIAARPEKKRLLIAVNCLAGVAIFFFGYDQGMMAGVNDPKSYVKRMGLGYKKNGSITVTNTLLQGSIISVYYLGTLVGCFMAMNPEWMITFRLINGIGTGILNATVLVYGSELVDYESRGMFIAMEFTLNILNVGLFAIFFNKMNL